MKVIVLPHAKAVEYLPQRQSYAIRIFSSFEKYKPGLNNKDMFLAVAEYIFDDNDIFPFELEVGAVWFTREIAKNIIKGFSSKKDLTEILLVNCCRGKNRSPAVAAALNDIFNLGNNSLEIMQKHPLYNHFVYTTLIAVSKDNQ